MSGSISEAQNAALCGLHLLIKYGKFDPSVSTIELRLKSSSKKQIEEWERYSYLPKPLARKKFFEILSSIFPNWRQSKELISEFQAKWTGLKFTNQSNTSTPRYKSKSFQAKQSTLHRRSIMSTSVNSDMLKSCTRPANNHQRLLKTSNDLSRKNRKASLDPRSKETQEALSSEAEILKKHRNSLIDGNYLKHFIEDLQSHKGGNIRNTSASKFPKRLKLPPAPQLPDPDPPIEFSTQLKQYRRTLLQQEFSKIKSSEPPSFHKGLDKIHDKICTLKLVLQQFTF